MILLFNDNGLLAVICDYSKDGQNEAGVLEWLFVLIVFF